MLKPKAQPKSKSNQKDRILRVTVGKRPKPLNGSITLVDYNTNWPRLFSTEAKRIADALRDTAFRVEHVGSTAVPNLVAKPIIDIVLTVANSADEESYIPNLETLGYELRVREPKWHEHRMLRVQRGIVINLHVFSEGDDEVERMVAFRDWLRNTPRDRELYAKTKKQLAAQDWKYVQNYADAKSKVVESIIARAQGS